MKKITTLMLALLVVLSGTYAQIAAPGTPPSFTYELKERVEVEYMPSFDVEAVLAEDEENMSKNEGPFRFAMPFEVDINPKNAGTWSKLRGGDRVWRMTFTSFDAHSLNFLFSKFYMPPGAELYVYNEDRSEVRGAFTFMNNKEDGLFAVTPIEGETVTLEYFEPAEVRGQGLLYISHVNHAYRDLHETIEEKITRGYGDSGSCNNDVACPVSAGWEDQIRSVAIMLQFGSTFCTGAMVNNTAQDATPYFLGANHCGTGINGNWSFAFNYDSPSCNGPDGDFSQSIVGGTLRAAYAPSDVTLFELSMPPPASYVVYYAGWNRTNVPAQNCTAIHHPAGDVKKISFNDDPVYEGDWGSGDANVPGGDHWVVDNWEDGTTEGGSSGSPLFDDNKLVIGQLHGGGASCSAVIYDSYGKFFTSWTGGGANSSRLSNWLDPQNIAPDTLHGAYFIDPPLAIDMQSATLTAPVGDYCDGEITPVIQVRNIGATDITSFAISYRYDGGALQTYNWTGGPIGFYGVETVTLPSTTLPLGPHTFDASITMPNGAADNDMSNNDFTTSNFEIINGNTLTVNLTTDEYPAETSYQIEDDMGTVVASGANFPGLQLNIDDFCLTDGCYTFTIFDSYGDGICCGYGEGNYVILDEAGILIGEGGEFTDQESINFCLPNVAPSPVAAFTTSSPEICVGQSISIENISEFGADYVWNAPGSTTPNSTDENPTFTYNATGTYTITLTANNTTGSDMTTATVEVIDGNILTINLFTDEYPQETTYELADDNGNVIFTGSGYIDQLTLNIDDFCLNDGCYVFTIVDDYGDGICCEYGQGSYEILDGAGTVLGSGGEFTTQESINFCLPVGSAPDAVAGFSINTNLDYCVGDEVAVNNTSQNADTYSWTATGATPATSTNADPVFVYNTAGTFTIELTATNSTSSDMTSQTVTINPQPMTSAISGAAAAGNGTVENYNVTLTGGSTYSWDITGGTQASGGTSNNISIMWDDMGATGQVCVTETSNAGCEGIPVCLIVDLMEVSTSDIELTKGLRIFPNPTTGMLFIESNEAPEQIQVFDILGQQLKTANTQSNTIDLTTFSTGVYLVKVTYDEGSVTKRIVVE